MSDNYHKLWIQQNLNSNAINRALQAIQSTGRALPCTVVAVQVDGFASLVTVEFQAQFPYTTPDGKAASFTLPPVTLPKAESPWMRSPTQLGDVGLTVPADTFLGGISGLGSGIAQVGVEYGNLSTLVWIPVAATAWTASPDPNKPWVNGPAGAVVSDTAQTATSVTSAHTITHTAGVGTANEVKTIYDGAGNAISHIVSSGGKIGLGALASGLGTGRAIPAKDDIQTLASNIVSQTLQTLSTAIGAAAVTATMPGAAAFAAILGASGFVTGLSGINPTIPSCSSIVHVAS